MKILLLRHGMTRGNLERRYVGAADEPLTEDCRARLARFARSGRGEEPGPASFYGRIGGRALVFTSPKRRCAETAELLFAGWPGAEPEFCADPGLAECDFGDFEYKNYRELSGDTAYQKFIDSGGTDGFPGGERVEDFKRRSAGAFEAILQKNRARPALVFVVHGGTIMAVMERFARPRRDYFSWQIGCGCGYFADARFEGEALSVVNVAKVRVL